MKENEYPSSIKPWKKYYSNFDENFVAPEKSMFMLLEENAKLKEDNIAINYLNFKMTFKKYIERIKHEANCLRNLGVKKGEIVPVFLPNIPEARTTIYALNLIGAISYPINPLISPKDFENILVKNDVKNIFMLICFIQNMKML